MPLILTLRPNEDFYVQDMRFVLDKYVNKRHCILGTRDGTGTTFAVTNTTMVEIYPGVKITVCRHLNSGHIRIVFKMAREVNVQRGVRYRARL